MAKVQMPRRGEIWMIDFDPSVGAEIQKRRPAVVVNLDSVGRLPLRIVVPITDWKSQYQQFPWFVFVPAAASNGLHKDSGVDCFQTKSVSENRFVHQIGKLTSVEL